jgi:ribosomal-protein-alanine N-acetyltransferase
MSKKSPRRTQNQRERQLHLRYQRLSDAKRFLEIRSHPDFVPFSPKPKSLKQEEAYLRKTAEKRKNNMRHNFTILYDGNVIGGVDLKVDQHRKYIGEIGYFVDRNHWGKGIATRAVRILEQFASQHLGINRFEIVTLPGNQASMRVAEKCGYKREGTQSGKQLHNGKYHDVKLFAKIRRIASA